MENGLVSPAEDVFISFWCHGSRVLEYDSNCNASVPGTGHTELLMLVLWYPVWQFLQCKMYCIIVVHVL